LYRVPREERRRVRALPNLRGVDPRKREGVKTSFDGIEIEGAADMKVFGEWIMFTDDDGAVIKIDPSAVESLYEFVNSEGKNGVL